MYGFFGKILRINLTEKTHRVEDVPDGVYERFLGGKGLGTYLLMENLRPGVDPLSEDNVMIFVTGPATDTVVPGSARYGVYSKSPLTGLYSESYSGGKVGRAMRRTGYDAIIVEGAARTPVYLEISDREVRFHDASHLWGKDTYATEDNVLAEVGVPGAETVVIGPAGENLVRFACLENNYWRSAGRTGLGAVMGSKKLKAIVFHGEARCQVADPDLLREAAKSVIAKGKDNPGVKAYRTYGTTVMVSVLNTAKTFPTRYWSEGALEGWEKISGDALINNFKVRSRACPGCFLSCAKLTEVTDGPRAGLKIEGPEYETIYSFGGLCCIDRLDEIMYLNDLCDRFGMDTISAGNLCALLMEAKSRGRLDVPLSYGDSGGVARLLEDIAYRRGVGDVLAQGIKYASVTWGLDDLAIHVKGLEPAGYDPRVLKGMGLAYATSTRGACHLRATFYKPELSGVTDPSKVEGKAEVFVDYENRLTIFSTQILCVFFRDLILWEDLERFVEGLTGLKYSRSELAAIANEIVTLTRRFNAREGATRDDDSLPSRFFAEAINDGKNAITPDEVKYMVDEYYRIRGWDQEF